MLPADVALFPDRASTVAPSVDRLYSFIIGVTVFVSTIVAVLVIYFAIKYRRRSETPPKPIVGSLLLESLWSGIPLAIVVVMFVWGARVYFEIVTPPEDAIEVFAVGRQWMWTVQHRDGQREKNELHIPVGKAVKVTLASEDVIHSFFIPDFRVKQDAVPGRYTQMWFEASKPGRFRLYCAEYCGTEHSKMIGWIVAQDPTEHEEWLASRADLSMALRGRQLFLRFQCVTCHSGDSQAKAPNLEAIYNRPVRLRDGTVLPAANDDYLRESILNPPAKVVTGYEPIMPTYQGIITEDELLQLIAFIKSLRPGETPPRNEQSTAPQSDPKAPQPKPFQDK